MLRRLVSRRSNRMMVLYSLLIGVLGGVFRSLGAPDLVFWLLVGSGNYLLGAYVAHLRLQEDGRLR